MSQQDLTTEQLDNLMKYGACPWCGWPRAVMMISHRDDDGQPAVTRGFVCTNPQPHEHGELTIPAAT